MTGPVELHHVVDGSPSAPALVLLDSLGTTLDMWDPQVAVLARHFRVIRCDLRGHGRSPVPPGPYSIADLGGDLLALLDRLGIERAHLCGLSIGGMIAMWVAAHEPGRVDRLVVCCSSAKLDRAETYRKRAATVRAEGTRAVAATVVVRWFTPAFVAADPALVDRMRATIASIPAEGYAACCDALAVMDLESDIESIVAPTLAIAGAQDEAIPPEHSYALAARIPRSRVIVVDDAAHLANIEQPAAVTGHILDHLSSSSQEDRP